MYLHEFNVPLRFHLTQEAEKIVVEAFCGVWCCPVHTYIITENTLKVKNMGEYLGFWGYFRAINTYKSRI
tara:strand:+ start:261 stop:470 length:210 start_codon:yes stop_codon:yes gene_type:complete